ncbi:MAG: copper resistance CopC family protein [Actinomycetota bacterium]
MRSSNHLGKNMSMRALATRSIVGALLLVLAGAFVAPASAAPSKVSSDPDEGEQLHEAPERVTITFDQPLDPSSHIEVENHCGDRVDEQPTDVNGTEMSVPVTGNWGGMYHVTYVAKGVAGVTGQQTGRFMFSVHAGAECDGGGGGGHDHGGGGGTGGGHDGGHEGGHGGGGHEGSGEHGSGAGAHDPGAHESAAHGSTTHGSAHGAHAGSGTDHAEMDHGGHSSDGKHADHHANGAGSERDETRNITSAPSGDLRGPGSDAVMLSLGLCALLGLLGGALLRFSAPK